MTNKDDGKNFLPFGSEMGIIHSFSRHIPLNEQ